MEGRGEEGRGGGEGKYREQSLLQEVQTEVREEMQMIKGERDEEEKREGRRDKERGSGNEEKKKEGGERAK